jgi:hypothetical protein
MTSGGTRLLALEMHLLFFIWVRNLFEVLSFIFVYFMLLLSNLKLFFQIFIVPLLIGMLVDLSLLSPFIGPDDDVPAVGFFCTWFLGRQLQNIGNYLVSCNFCYRFLTSELM